MKKPTIKINFLYYEEPFDVKNNFFINLLKKNYEVVLSDNPDYVFFSVYKKRNRYVTYRNSASPDAAFSDTSNRSLSRKIKNFLKRLDFIQDFVGYLKFKRIIRGSIPEIEGNFVKILYTYENVFPDMKKCDWAFGFAYEEEVKSSRYMRLPFYYLLTGENGLIKTKENIEKLRKQKTKFCNFIYTSHIPLRNKFFKKLSRYKQIDSPGKVLTNMPPIGLFKTTFDSRSAKDWAEQKQEFLKKYKFTIAFENSASPGYTTEKIVQPMLAGSIPIYWGNPEIGKEFNKKSFLDLRDFRNMDELIKKIKEIDENDALYEKMLNEPWLINNVPNKWMNEKRILAQLIKIIESKR